MPEDADGRGQVLRMWMEITEHDAIGVDRREQHGDEMTRNNPHWPNGDERRWSYESVGYRRGGWHRPNRRRWRRRYSSHDLHARIFAVLAFVGAISLGGLFLELMEKLTGS